MSANTLLLLTSLILFIVAFVHSVPPIVLPDVDDQCRYQNRPNSRYVGACKVPADKEHLLCKRLMCAVEECGRYIMEYGREPLEGTKCGHMKICRNRKCVPSLCPPMYTGPSARFDCEFDY